MRRIRAGLLAAVKCSRPAAMGFDEFVNIGQDADGLAEGDDDLLVVLDVLVG